MGSGKSTVGPVLANAISHKFCDMDTLIQSLEQRSIPEIFNDEGEEYFRRLERKILADLISSELDIVIATGGGTIIDEANFVAIKENGVSFYLCVPRKILTERLWEFKSSRPLLNTIESKTELKQFIDQHLVKREPFYFKADFIIDASRTVNEIVDDIRSHINFQPTY